MWQSIKIIFLLCLLLAPISRSAEDGALAAANGLFQSQNYSAAITEYKRFIFFNPDDNRIGEAFKHMGFAYRMLSQWDKAIESFQTEADRTESDSVRDEMKLNIALTMIAKKDYLSSELQLTRLIYFSRNIHVIKKARYFLGIVFLYQYQWEAARISFHQYFDDTTSVLFYKIDSLLNSKNIPENKSPSIAVLISSIVPGSGQFYAEQYGDGINGLLINAVSGFLLIDSILEHRYQDAGIAFLPLFYRYYQGNRLNAEREAVQYNQRVNSEHTNSILKVLSSSKLSQN